MVEISKPGLKSIGGKKRSMRWRVGRRVVGQFAARMRADNLADRGARIQFPRCRREEEEAEEVGGGEF